MKKLTKKNIYYLLVLSVSCDSSLSEAESRPDDWRLLDASERESRSDSFSSSSVEDLLFCSDSAASLRCLSGAVLRLTAGAESPMDSASDTTLLMSCLLYTSPSPRD